MGTIPRCVASLIMLFVGAVFAEAASPCPSADTPVATQTSKHTSAQHKSSHGEKPSPCDEPSSQPGESQLSVGWDPIACWDCPTAADYYVVFILGSLASAAIFLCVRRAKTRREEPIS